MSKATKRFILMAGSMYYALGGFLDFQGSFDTKEEAQAAERSWLDNEGIDMENYVWTHIADLETGDLFINKKAEAGIAGLMR